MFLVYIDDSGDEHVRCFSALILHESVWKESLDRIKDYRRALKASDGIYVTKEFHATEFVAGRGQIADRIVTKARRIELFKETLAFVTGLPKIQIINGFYGRKDERALFERMMNRINRTMAEWRSHALIICDEGKDYTPLVRRMMVFNPIQSRFGAWPDGSLLRNLPLTRIVEDPVFRDSSRSYFIQLADFVAYALFRHEVPLESKAKYGLHHAFDLLHPICVRAAYARDPKRLGIIRYP